VPADCGQSFQTVKKRVKRLKISGQTHFVNKTRIRRRDKERFVGRKMRRKECEVEEVIDDVEMSVLDLR